jgi:hypothetical protein
VKKKKEQFDDDYFTIRGDRVRYILKSVFWRDDSNFGQIQVGDFPYDQDLCRCVDLDGNPIDYVLPREVTDYSYSGHGYKSHWNKQTINDAINCLNKSNWDYEWFALMPYLSEEERKFFGKYLLSKRLTRVFNDFF